MKINVSSPVTFAAVHSKAVGSVFVYLLFIIAPTVCGGFVLGPCFVVRYFVSFLVLQSSRWERESWLLYFYCFLDAMWLLLFFASSSWYCGLVCSVIVAFPGHTHLLLENIMVTYMYIASHRQDEKILGQNFYRIFYYIITAVNIAVYCLSLCQCNAIA